MCALVAALGGLLFGFDTAVIGGAEENIRAIFGFSTDTSSGNWHYGFTVASALIGTILGALFVGKPTERYGRRPIFFVLAMLYVVCALGCAFAWDWYSLLAARFLGGLAVGGASVVCPMYIAELAPTHLRGRLVAITQLNVVLGILLALLSNYILNGLGDAGRLPTELFSFLPESVLYVAGQDGAEGVLTTTWRWMLGIQLVPSVLFFLLVFFIPESPRWLIKNGRNPEALATFKRVGTPNPEGVLNEVVESLHTETVSVNEPFFRKKYAMPILLAFLVASFNQLAGINAILYYAPTIFKMAGASTQSALFQSVLFGTINFIFTMIGMLLIDKFGRKKLLLIGSAGLTVCLLVVGIGLSGTLSADAANAAADSALKGKLVLGGLLTYIAFFAFSSGAVIWVYISEIFPNRVRGRGQALGSMTHWVWAAIITFAFPVIAQSTQSAPFYFFAAMMVLQFILVWRLFPETKGVSLEEIQKKLGIQ